MEISPKSVDSTHRAMATALPLAYVECVVARFVNIQVAPAFFQSALEKQLLDQALCVHENMCMR